MTLIRTCGSLLLTVLAFIPFLSSAQADTSFVSKAVHKAASQYQEAIGVQAHVYSGPEYFVPGKPHAQGHPFFVDKTYQSGQLSYDGAQFGEIPLLYDLVMDQLVTINQGGGHAQLLVKGRVAGFELHGHTFVHLQPDSGSTTHVVPGFYDLRYKGDVADLIIKRGKYLYERTTTDGLEGEYRLANKYYIVKDGAYHSVSNKASVLRVLQDQKKQLRKFANTQNLQFKKEREEAILQTLRYYNSLHQQP
jgi:hypothetical protein